MICAWYTSCNVEKAEKFRADKYNQSRYKRCPLSIPGTATIKPTNHLVYGKVIVRLWCALPMINANRIGNPSIFYFDIFLAVYTAFSDSVQVKAFESINKAKNQLNVLLVSSYLRLRYLSKKISLKTYFR